MKKQVQSILQQSGVPLYGICRFADVLPLLPCRAAARLPKDAKSVVMVAFPYKTEGQPQNISRYATVPDYHTVCGHILQGLAAQLQAALGGLWEPFVDNSPIPEVKAAVLAGLGVQGKNGLLITKNYGSFVFLGELVTDLVLPATAHSGQCANCGACAAVCPSDCIGKEKSTCLSAVTQKKGDLTLEETEKIRATGCIWGCDLCQNVCPHNQSAQNTPIAAFTKEFLPSWHPGDPIEGRAFAWRGEKVITRNANLLKK